MDAPKMENKTGRHRKKAVGLCAVVLFLAFLAAGCAEKPNSLDTSEMPDMDQKILSFNLANYGEDGTKKWNLTGDSADILAEIIYLNNILVDTYEEPKSKLTSDEGTYDRKSQVITLYKNVLLTTDDGMELVTDSIDWDGANDTITTADPVKITRSDVIANGLGAKAIPALEQLELHKDVVVVLLRDAMGETPLDETEEPAGEEEFKATITCDGPLEIDYANNIAVFKNNVKVDDDRGQIYSELMKAYMDPVTKNIVRVEAEENVIIVRGEDSTYSERAIYTTADQKVVLLGKPKIFIRADEEIDKIEQGFSNPTR